MKNKNEIIYCPMCGENITNIRWINRNSERIKPD